MSKKINQLTSATDPESQNDSYLFAIADPTNGVALKMTVAQAKEAFGTKTLTYKATGLEGTTLTLSQLAGKDILAICRSSGLIYLADAAPEPDEYLFNSIDITLGVATNLNEKFLFIYRNF